MENEHAAAKLAKESINQIIKYQSLFISKLKFNITSYNWYGLMLQIQTDKGEIRKKYSSHDFLEESNLTVLVKAIDKEYSDK